MSLPWSNRFDYDYNKPRYGRGPAPWQTEAPRARHVGGKFFNPPSSGTQQDFTGRWPGDPEFNTPRLDRGLSSIRQFAGNYIGTKLAVHGLDKDLQEIEEDVHRLANPNELAASRQTLTDHEDDAFGRPVGSKRRDAFGNLSNRLTAPQSGPTQLGPTRADMVKPKYGRYGDVEAGDARLAGSASEAPYQPSAVDVTPGRRGSGGNDRRLRGLIARQLNDRM